MSGLMLLLGIILILVSFYHLQTTLEDPPETVRKTRRHWPELARKPRYIRRRHEWLHRLLALVGVLVGLSLCFLGFSNLVIGLV